LRWIKVAQNSVEAVAEASMLPAMSTRAWFPSFIYCAPLQKARLHPLNIDLIEECHRLRDYDEAGRSWCEKNYPGGYTSYGSMSQLQQFSSTFSNLEKKLDRHVRAFAEALDMDLGQRPLRMSDCWVNVMPKQVAHGLHLHPLSVISGTYYVSTPRGCPGLKFEDPRLASLMAAPPKKADARRENRTHIVYPAKAGNVILFESWLRHEVPANRSDAERISISFNYCWA
jgi:uncharacterized protein (TIGR02466 family)